jgi:hypothetical protein
LIDIPSILSENQKRIEKLFAPYDPIKGTGGPLKREKMVLEELGEYYLPIEFFDHPIGQMFAKAKSLHRFVEKFPDTGTVDLAYDLFINERIKFDFEFWCADAVKIKPKSGGKDIPFILNPPQRKVHALTYDDIINQRPIRQIIDKSRQWGGSTVKIIEGTWIQTVHKTNWNMLVAAHINQAATNIRSMVKRIQKNYPEHLPHWDLSAFEGSTNVKYIPQRDNKIIIGSIETPDSIRSEDIAICHATEIASWKKTEGKSPEDLVQSILGTIPRLPFTMFALESTAKGVGNFFHRAWQGANAEGAEWNGMTPIFVSWIEDRNNFEEFKSQNDMIDFVHAWNDYDKFLWEMGSTIQGINFYHQKLREFNNDEWRMKSEFPTTAEESFQSTGHPVFFINDILQMEKTCCDPIFVGDIQSDAQKGNKAFDNIRLVPNSNGYLSIWSMPEPIVEIEGKKYHVLNRYCGFGDIGGKGKKADYSELTIVDKYMMLPEFAMYGGLPEIAAQWHGHYDHDLMAWQWAMLGWMYGKMLLAIEEISLEKKKTEGDHYLTVMDEVGEFYPNLFVRETIDRVSGLMESKYGWKETHQSKVQTVDYLNSLFRERGYIERDLRAMAQARMFEHKQDGTMGAVDGQKDDMVTTRKGALWIAIKGSPPPRLVLIEENKREVKSKMGMANF